VNSRLRQGYSETLRERVAGQARLTSHTAAQSRDLLKNLKGKHIKQIMKVGFIGLGHMGNAMASRLVQAGHEVTVYNRTLSKAQPLVVQGAHLATRVADACQGDVVITMLADDDAVEKVVLGQSGVLQSLDQRTIHVSMSTIGVALSNKLADAHATAGRRLVAAPVFGRPNVAAEGKLFIIAAGEADVIESCMPLFDAMGQKTFRIGEVPQAANLVKLSGNFITASVMEAMSEAMALVRKGGIDAHQYFELLTSTIFTCPVFTNYGGGLANGKSEPGGFAASLGEKDIRLALAAAQTLRVPMPLASVVHDRLQTLIARGGEQVDWSALGLLAANDAGLIK
jgi:3-hydroxyisobutyrate dehydrogenase-like beta-hydroxyacid dehydrogenase